MAWDELRAQFAKDAEVNLIQAVSRLDDLYEEASKSGYDFNSQVNILKEKHKIMGMYTEKQEIKQEVDIRFDFDE
jgi:type I site-specific restriction-modification system R (restriction) subunit